MIRESLSVRHYLLIQIPLYKKLLFRSQVLISFNGASGSLPTKEGFTIWGYLLAKNGGGIYGWLKGIYSGYLYARGAARP